MGAMSGVCASVDISPLLPNARDGGTLRRCSKKMGISRRDNDGEMHFSGGKNKSKKKKNDAGNGILDLDPDTLS